MKKIFYLFVSLVFMFTSCNPLEDLDAELAESTKLNRIVGDVSRTLSDEDYEILDLSYGNFSSEDDAKEMLPSFLSGQYPALGVIFKEDGSINEASSAAITYNLYSPISKQSYTATAADYADFGATSLNTASEFNSFLGSKFPSEANGTVVELTYNTLAPQIDYTLEDADYALVGNGNFNNFDIRSGSDDEPIEARRVKIEQILLNNFPDTPAGQQYLVTYDIYDGSSAIRQMLVQLNASNEYVLINGYTLTDEDFALVGNGRFNNFDIRSGKDEETVEARRAKIETILLENFPSAVSGDQYFVTYAVYDGASGTRNMLLEFDGLGYMIVEATLISKTTRYTYTGSWSEPVTFTPAEYSLMGQSYPNFSNSSEAHRLIAIHLETLYPFAAAEDFLAVEYDYYSGSASVRNTNFVFDGTVWNAIPTVIETTLKFGHDGNSWVPDNTIKYTLTNADFALVDNGRYNNFDVRAGKAEETVASRVVKLNVILKANFPASAQGQKFSVTYAVFDGANGVRITNVILEGSDYILQ
jgi:hypothetical protein